MKRFLSFLILFSSTSTLVCCAIPALLVSLGMGAALVGIIGSFPQLVWFSENKVIVFSFGALLLLAGGLMQWRIKNESCPVDPVLGEACKTTRDWSRVVYFISLALYLIGAFFAFFAPYFFS
jgi:hypothetical protein